MTGRLTKRAITTGAAAVALAASAFAAGSVSALPGTGDCAVAPTTPARCPTVVQRSPDLSTLTRSVVADAARHRVYVVGTDEAGWESFRAVDTRSDRVVVQANYRATTFAEDAAAGVNSWSARVTPDGRDLLSAGYVYRPDGAHPAMVAIDTSSGLRKWLWVDSHAGGAGFVTLDPSGRRAFLAYTETEAGGNSEDALMRGFDVLTGRTLWRSRVDHEDGVDRWFMAVTFAAGRVIAVGTAAAVHGARSDTDQLVVAADPRSGRLLGVRTLDDGGYEFSLDATVLSDNRSVVITGAHESQAAAEAPAMYVNETETVAVDAKRMTLQWRNHEAATGGLGEVVAAAGDKVLVGYVGAEVYPVEGTADPVARGYAGVGGALGVQALDARSGKELWHRDDVAPTATTFELSNIVIRRSTAYVVGSASNTGIGLSSNLPQLGSSYSPGPSDGFVAALDVTTGTSRWASAYNDDANGLYSSTFDAAVSTTDGLFVAGSMDTRTRSPWSGTINGTLLRYAP